MNSQACKRGFARLLPRKPAWTVLTYHSVGCERCRWSLPRALFAEQVAALKESCELQDAVDVARQALAANTALDAPVTAITFDDGYRDVLDVAAPILSAAGVPFLVFITTDLMDDHRAMQWSPHYRDVPPLSWAGVTELLKAGGVIGAHTCSHPRLRGLTRTQLVAEIQGSKAKLEDKLGIAVTSFAYPFGQDHDYDRLSAQVVAEAGFEAAFTTKQKSITRRDRRWEIPRLTVSEHHGAEDVIDLVSRRYDFMRWYGRFNSTLVRAGIRQTVEHCSVQPEASAL